LKPLYKPLYSNINRLYKKIKKIITIQRNIRMLWNLKFM